MFNCIAVFERMFECITGSLRMVGLNLSLCLRECLVVSLCQGHNTVALGFEPPTSRSGVQHSTTEPPCSPITTVSSDDCFIQYNAI